MDVDSAADIIARFPSPSAAPIHPLSPRGPPGAGAGGRLETGPERRFRDRRRREAGGGAETDPGLEQRGREKERGTGLEQTEA